MKWVWLSLEDVLSSYACSNSTALKNGISDSKPKSPDVSKQVFRFIFNRQFFRIFNEADRDLAKPTFASCILGRVWGGNERHLCIFTVSESA